MADSTRNRRLYLTDLVPPGPGVRAAGTALTAGETDSRHRLASILDIAESLDLDFEEDEEGDLRPEPDEPYPESGESRPEPGESHPGSSESPPNPDEPVSPPPGEAVPPPAFPVFPAAGEFGDAEIDILSQLTLESEPESEPARPIIGLGGIERAENWYEPPEAGGGGETVPESRDSWYEPPESGPEQLLEVFPDPRDEEAEETDGPSPEPAGPAAENLFRKSGSDPAFPREKAPAGPGGRKSTRISPGGDMFADLDLDSLWREKTARRPDRRSTRISTRRYAKLDVFGDLDIEAAWREKVGSPEPDGSSPFPRGRGKSTIILKPERERSTVRLEPAAGRLPRGKTETNWADTPILPRESLASAGISAGKRKRGSRKPEAGREKTDSPSNGLAFLDDDEETETGGGERDGTDEAETAPRPDPAPESPAAAPADEADSPGSPPPSGKNSPTAPADEPPADSKGMAASASAMKFSSEDPESRLPPAGPAAGSGPEAESEAALPGNRGTLPAAGEGPEKAESEPAEVPPGPAKPAAADPLEVLANAGEGEAAGGADPVAVSPPAEPAAAVDPLDVFANIGEMDFSGDDSLDDEMKAMLSGDGEEAAGGNENAAPAAAAAGTTGSAGEAEETEPESFPGRLVFRARRFIVRKIGACPGKILQAVAWKENWWFYCDLAAAVVASASLAVIISY
ncbi:MAG: hypothetical protein LBU64_02705, partial [Planctomycetota bacterium]|nr:hypothetical protein [Planctomycetota bacterium]